MAETEPGTPPVRARIGHTGEGGRRHPAMGLSHQPRDEELPINHLGLVDVGLDDGIVADGPDLQPRQLERPREPREHARPLARELGRHEDEQLVHEVLLQERGCERRAALEEKGLDTLGGQRLELVTERGAPELELRSLGERPPAECDSPGLARDRDVAGVEPGIVPAHGSHADGNDVRGRAEHMDETPRLLARDPARAGHGDTAVERDRDLVRHERTLLRGEGAPLLDLLPAAESELVLGHVDLDLGGTEALQATAFDVRVGISLTRDDSRHPCLDQRVRAGGRGPMVRAGLEGHVDGRSPGALAGGSEGGEFVLGFAVLPALLAQLVFGALPPGHVIDLHPIAVAGWFGFFVTALNLIPAGQLDGGHLVYALFGRRHSLISKLAVGGLMLIGLVFGSPTWLIWSALIVALMGFHHGPTMDDITPLDAPRRLLGLFALALIFVLLPPVPLGVY